MKKCPISAKICRKTGYCSDGSIERSELLDVVFEMRFDVLSNYTANGYDDAEFMISTNPGEPVRPLGKVASGENFQELCLR